MILSDIVEKGRLAEHAAYQFVNVSRVNNINIFYEMKGLK